MMLICPICNKGILEKKRIQEVIHGVDLGIFPAEVCSKCGESFTDKKVTIAMERVAKEKGIWGWGRITNITRTGNSLAVRIPKALADHLGIKEGTPAHVYQHKNKIIIEPKVA